MKRRFYFGDDNHNDEEDENEDDFDNTEFFQMAQIPFDSLESSILESSIRICESSFFWKFYNIDYKLKKIKQTYEYLQTMVEEEIKMEKDA